MRLKQMRGVLLEVLEKVVYVAAVSDFDDEYQKNIVTNLTKHSIIAYAISPLACPIGNKRLPT